jgi:hypothetical protein
MKEVLNVGEIAVTMASAGPPVWSQSSECSPIVVAVIVVVMVRCSLTRSTVAAVQRGGVSNRLLTSEQGWVRTGDTVKLWGVERNEGGRGVWGA